MGTRSCNTGGATYLNASMTGHRGRSAWWAAGAWAGRVEGVGSHPLLDLTTVATDDVEGFLGRAGEVFAVHRGHDSGNTSAGVIAGGRRWFVKWATDPEAIGYLESAVRFHAAVRHPAIAALRSWFTFPSGLGLVHDWVPGEVLNDPLAPGGLPRQDPRSAFARFRRLPVPEVLAAYGTVLDAHRA